jgi:hypothetical protein
MDDLDVRLRVLDDVRAPDLRADVLERLRHRTAPEPFRPAIRRRGERLVAATVAVAVFGAAAIFGWSIYERASEANPPATSSDPWSWATEGWTELQAPPEQRDGAAVVWTGTELLYWGGFPRGADDPSVRTNGFAFDPTTRTWRTIPSAPTGLARGDAVWTGSEALFWGELAPEQETDVPKPDFSAVLAYNPAQQTWRALPPSPHEVPSFVKNQAAWAWTGRELIVWGGGEPDSGTAVGGAALDPSTGSWRAIADAPAPMTLANAVWTGTEMVVVGAALDPGNRSTTPTAVAQAYDPPTDTWRRLPDPPLSPQASETVWFGDEVVAWDYGSDSARYLPSEDRWQGLGKLPLDHGECYVGGVAVQGALFAWNCGYPDAWYPGVGWSDVEGGPAFDVPVSEVTGMLGRVIAADAVAVVEQIDNVERGEQIIVGSSDAPMHLWAWRSSATPPQPRPVTRQDVETLVSNFVYVWDGYEPYLPTLATKDVIDRCRTGTGGCLRLASGQFEERGSTATEIGGAIYEVDVKLRQPDGTDVMLTFVAGPGRTADGREAQLVLTDVQPSAE